MDTFWLKTLAQAHYKDGQWSLAEPAKIKERSKKNFLSTIPELLEQVHIAIETYNEVSPEHRRIRVLPLNSGQNEGSMVGFILLLSTVQLRLVRNNGRLDLILTILDGFKKHDEQLHTFEPIVDALGGLSWIMDRKSIMTIEMMLKQILHDLCSSAYEQEWKG